MSNPCPPPRGVKVTNSTIATHRPVDYSSSCGLLYSPAHHHAVWCRQRSSRRPLSLPCRLLTLPGSRSFSLLTQLQMQIVSPSASRPLSSWQRLHSTLGEDVRLNNTAAAYTLTPCFVSHVHAVRPEPCLSQPCTAASCSRQPGSPAATTASAVASPEVLPRPQLQQSPARKPCRDHSFSSRQPGSPPRPHLLQPPSDVNTRPCCQHGAVNLSPSTWFVAHTPLLLARSRPPRSIAPQQPR